MAYVNNYSELVELAPGVTTLALALPDGSYRLTLSDAAGTRWEIVDAVVASGTATLTRAQEGTTEQDWPAGSLIYCAVTAGQLNDLLARLQALETALGTRSVTVTVPASEIVAGFYMLDDVRQGSVEPASIDVPGVGATAVDTLMAYAGANEFTAALEGMFDPAVLVSIDVQGIGVFLLGQAIDTFSEDGYTGWTWSAPNASEWLSGGSRIVTFRFAY